MQVFHYMHSMVLMRETMHEVYIILGKTDEDSKTMTKGLFFKGNTLKQVQMKHYSSFSLQWHI